MKRIKSLLFLGIILALMLSLFSGCNTNNGQLYTLDQAYDNGWLSQEDLINIAYYWNNGYYWNNENADINYIVSSATSGELDSKLDKKIRKAYLQDFNAKYKNGKLSNIHIYKYYGTYGDCQIVYVSDDINKYDYIFEKEILIGGILFTHYCSALISVWHS